MYDLTAAKAHITTAVSELLEAGRLEREAMAIASRQARQEVMTAIAKARSQARTALRAAAMALPIGHELRTTVERAMGELFDYGLPGARTGALDEVGAGLEAVLQRLAARD